MAKKKRKGATSSTGVKVPKWEPHAKRGKTPVFSRVTSPTEATISWCMNRIDWDGPWPWHAMNDKKQRDVYEVLGGLERHTLASAPRATSNKGSKGQIKELTRTLKTADVHDPRGPKELLKRLRTLKLDDADIWELRITGPNRVIFVVYPPSFCHLVFWDPRHECWPSSD